MRTRAGISTSDIRFKISTMVSAVRADATEVPMPNPLAPTVYPLQGGKVHPNFESKKKFFRKKIFWPSLRPEKYTESMGEIRF